MERFFDAVLEAVAPTAAELLVKLDASQRAELFARLDERIAEARAEYVDPPPDRQQRGRADCLESRLEPPALGGRSRSARSSPASSA